MVAPIVKAEYERFIETFTYRVDDAIKIPKRIRKKAYQLAIDIIIVSVARQQFLNFDATPPDGYYGKATLVLQDCADRTIDLSQPRQRIYEGRVVEAFQFWDALIEFEYHRYYYDILPRFFDAVLNALAELPTPPLVSTVIDLLKELLAFDCLSLPDKPWLELPLREVYVNVLPRTQYKIEISYTEPVKFTDGCGNERTGESFQTDGEKDDGLPDDGAMPDDADDPDDPFAGLPPASSENEQGDFANDKTDRLGQIDPVNSPQTTGGGNPSVGNTLAGVSYNVTVNFGVDYVNGSGATVGNSTGSVYFAIVIGEILSISSATPATVFGGDFIGIVASQIIIVAQNGTLSGQLNNTNINPPFSSQFGASSWKLNGINGFAIVPN